MKLIIRDDDCNYFTRPEDLESVYSQIPDFPVTFAVVPTVTDLNGGCPETKGNKTPRSVGDNKELVSYLRKKYNEGKCDIVMHGITHGYKYDENGTKVPEMIWRNSDSLLDSLIRKGKSELESIFEIPIGIFVAPSNRVEVNTIQSIVNNDLHFSGIVAIKFNRQFNTRSIVNYLKRLFVRATTGFAYPGVLNYGDHLELNANNHINYDYLVKLFRYCDKHNYPLAINVHYWHIRDNKELYNDFFNFIKYAIEHGAVPSRMRDVLY